MKWTKIEYTKDLITVWVIISDIDTSKQIQENVI